jgi:hypothetical protein
MDQVARAQPMTRAMMFATRLKLNSDQKKKTQPVIDDADKQITPLRAQMDLDRVQITELMVNNGSQDDIKKLMEAYSAAAAQVTDIEVNAFAQICALLKPDQLTKAASAFDLLAVALDPPGSDGKAGSGGGRRGKH